MSLSVPAIFAVLFFPPPHSVTRSHRYPSAARAYRTLERETCGGLGDKALQGYDADKLSTAGEEALRMRRGR